MNLYNSLENSFAQEFGQHVLENYRGWRTWGQLNVGSKVVSSDACECCMHVRQNLIPTAANQGVLFWLVDVKKLHQARRAGEGQKGNGVRCGFCAIIHQQFWAWQLPEYRMRSQLLARKLREVEEREEMVPWTIIQDQWKDVGVRLVPVADPMPCFTNVSGYSAKNCPTSSCNVCFQDNYASLEFGELTALCEACRRTIDVYNGNGDVDGDFRPAIPLLLKPTIVNDCSAFSKLGIKHAGGELIYGGSAQEWAWWMYTLPDDKAASVVPSFHRVSYDHDGVYERIRDWRKACSNHLACQQRRAKSPELPLRVLTLNNTECRLRETSSEYGEYVALSYCWGAPQPSRLTRSNLEEYKRHIDLDKLPTTIQHAAIVARKLGYSYLWVDSMCIVQDDEADKLSEISKMQSIYADSSLTVCASGARHCNEGLFHAACIPGTTIRMPDIGVNYPCNLPDGSRGHVRLIERAQYKPQAEALTWRAWAYQEELLPTNVVRFGACLSWECDEVSDLRTLSSLTGGIDSQVPFSTLFVDTDANQHVMRRVLHIINQPSAIHPATITLRSPDRSLCPTLNRPSGDHTSSYMMQTCTCDDGAISAAWQMAVSNYTTRALSDPADKLPALAGLAMVFSRVRNDEYLAGLWRSRLVHDLMWAARPPLRPRDNDVGRRRHTGRAPSWSWACLDAGIDVVGAHNRILSCHLDNCAILEQKVTAEVVDCDVKHYDASNPFGAVTGGHVTIDGALIKLKLTKGDYLTMLRIEGANLQLVSDAFAKISHPSDFASPHMDLVQFQSPDLEGLGSLEEGIDLWCLQMREEVVLSTRVFPGRDRPEKVILMDGLLLLPSLTDTGAFRRIGVWVTEYRGVIEEDDHPFRHVDPQLVKIV